MRTLRGWTAACCLALAGCVSVPEGRGVAVGTLSAPERAAAEAVQAAREARLGALPAFSFAGRVALSSERGGGSGRLEWRQAGGRFEVTLAAPVTRQSWRLVGDASGGRIEGIAGGPRSGSDVAALLREATGLEVPVGALAAWAAGLRADPGAFGPARIGFGPDGRLARVEQGGWTIDYLGWRETDPGDGGGLLQVPDRIDAQRGDARVRLAIDAWSWSDAP